MVAGSIDVVGSSEAASSGGAHLEVSQLEGALTVTLEGDTLTISHEKLTWGGLLDWVGNHKASAVVSVSVPDACPVELGVVSADAVVSGITGDTKVKSVSGNVTLDGLDANISAQTVSGDLETRRVQGKLRFTTVSGDLTVVNGSSSQVKAETVSGDVTLDLDVAPGARLDLNSVSGDVTLRLPDSAGLQIEAKTIVAAWTAHSTASYATASQVDRRCAAVSGPVTASCRPRPSPVTSPCCAGRQHDYLSSALP